MIVQNDLINSQIDYLLLKGFLSLIRLLFPDELHIAAHLAMYVVNSSRARSHIRPNYDSRFVRHCCSPILKFNLLRIFSPKSHRLADVYNFLVKTFFFILETLLLSLLKRVSTACDNAPARSYHLQINAPLLP